MSESIVILDQELKPKPIEASSEVQVRNLLWQYAKKLESHPGGHAYPTEDRRHVEDKTPVLGSEDLVRQNGDYGFFSAVMEAYNNHWTLVTTPEDWFYTIIQKVAKAVDDHSKRPEVRKFFVDHTEAEGKKKLTVAVDEDGPMSVDYSWFIDQMTQQIQQNINVEGYVNLMTADFSTSTKTHQIVSGITVMTSLQEYFEYEMMCGCGIPGVVMKGTLQDWQNLKTKILALEKMLQPIMESINLSDDWWRKVEVICTNLIDTYNKKPDINMWWCNIICKTTRKEYGPSGYPLGDKPAYDGWFITGLLNLQPVGDFTEISSGLVTVPMTITKPMASEDSTFIAGIAGYKLEESEQDVWPRVSALHSWTLLLEPKSVFRPALSAWESTMRTAAKPEAGSVGI